VDLGEERIILVSSLTGEDASGALVETIIDSAAEQGLSVAVVDGSSSRRSEELGLTDLCAGVASFGEIVHRGPGENMSHVPWGRQSRLDHHSRSAVTLARALADLFDLVVVTTGRPGIASSLPVFSGVEGQILVAANQDVDPATVEGIR